MDAFNSQVQSLAMNPSAPPHPAMSQPQTPYEYQRPIQFSGEHFSNPLSAHPQIAYSPYLPHTSMYQHHPPYIHLSSAHMPNYGYPPQPYYENPQTGDFSVETMHGMPGYPGRPPIPRSSHTSPLNPSPPYPHYPSSQPHSRPSTAQTQAYGGMWGSPPMSPVLEPMQYGSIGSLATMGRDDRLRHPSQVDEFGGMQGGRSMFYPTGPLASWNAPSVSSPYAFYSPYQQQAPTMAMRSGQEPWSTDTSPALAQGAFASRGSWTGQPPPSNSQLNRMSWSGPSRPTVRTSAESPDREKERERKAYHPQPPARRSDWVMWVGNV